MKNTFNILLALLIFTGSLFCLWIGGKWLFGQVDQFNWSEIPISTGLGLILAFFGMSWIANTLNKVAKNLVEKEHISAKRTLYTTCLKTAYNIKQASDSVPSLEELYQQFLISAGPQVILAFRNWQDAISKETSSHELELDRLLFAMRKDLGISNQGLLVGQNSTYLPGEKHPDLVQNGQHL